MTMATTTIRIDYAMLPDHFDRSRPNAIAEVIETALRDDGIKVEASDIFSHIKIELPTSQLAAASAVLAELQLI
jgi:predicted nucleic-acid-binding protein